MSQVQRRRTVRLSGDSEEFSESSYDDADFVKGSEGEIDLNANREGQRESAYEKAEPHEENGTDEEDQGTPGEDDDLSDSVIIEYEREDGDGQVGTVFVCLDCLILSLSSNGLKVYLFQLSHPVT
uniref:Uncharacterized protein n=2 Tax=Timema TaxID=61471 RepID=A0A7R8VZE6_TIMDO|nr:unnamed protein product [Timema douglasi]